MMVLISIISFIILHFIDRQLSRIVEPYIDTEVERLTNNIVNLKVNEIMSGINKNDLFLFEKQENDNNKISYDTKKMNDLKSRITKEIQDEIADLDNGKIDDYFIPTRLREGKFKNVKKGILCDVSIGSVRGSTLFANISPTIPIKLLFSSQLNSDIDVKTKEYGINNVIIEVYFKINVEAQITMPLTSKRKKIEIREPLAIDIISGKIPNYYGGYIK